MLLADINQVNLTKAVLELSSKFGQDRIAGTLADVRKMDDGAKIISDAVQKWGGVDVLVCNAVGYLFLSVGLASFTRLLTPPFSLFQAIPSSSHIEDLTEEHFDNVIATNLKGMFTVIKPVIPIMKQRGGGKIVTLGSEMGFAAVPESPAYNASKGGVIMFTKSLALDLIRYGIRVNSLCPGVTMTPLLEQEIAAAPDPVKHREMQNSELFLGNVFGNAWTVLS